MTGLLSSALTQPTAQVGPGGTNTSAIAEVNQVVKRRKCAQQYTDGGTAATDATEFVLMQADVASTIIGVVLAFPAAITADNTNYKTITVAKRTGSGSAVTVASLTTKITDPVLGANAVAFVPYTMTNSGTIANLSLAAADVLTVKAIHSGNGVALATATAPASVWVIYEEA